MGDGGGGRMNCGCIWCGGRFLGCGFEVCVEGVGEGSEVDVRSRGP